MAMMLKGRGARTNTLLSFFRADSGGNVAVTFAVGAVVIIGAMGVALDFSRRSNIEARLQAAADAAVLHGAHVAAKDANRAEAAARGAFTANIADLGMDGIQPVVTVDDGRVSLDVSTDMSTTLAAVLGLDSARISVSAEALMSGDQGKPLEIAIALDNTSSMAADMDSLRSTASSFVGQIFALDPAARVALVPYVAAVNPGIGNLSPNMVDRYGEARWHASSLRGTYIGWTPECGGTPPSQRGPSGGYIGSSSGQDRSGSLDVRDLPSRFAGVLADWLFISAAHAQSGMSGPGVTPATVGSLTGNWYRPANPDPAIWPGLQAQATMQPGMENHQAFVPNGFPIARCELYNPTVISHLDLFDRIPNVSWKGCVEARAEPYDVDDTVPTPGNPDTLFVPYFWIDEADKFAEWSAYYHNNYMHDGPAPVGWDHDAGWGRMFSIMKYNGVSNATIQENAPSTMGPNKACPDPMLPLTDNKSIVLDRIAGLNYWNNGGTISSEGLMWAWRALSPEPPFTEGRAWDEAEKVIVLMSDGLNSLVEQPDPWHVTDYSAYGFMRGGRFNIHTFDYVEDKLNQRFSLACRNAKARGIRIFTVLFREDSPAAIKLMENCASQLDYAFRADNANELAAAFSGIASKLPPGSGLRLSR